MEPNLKPQKYYYEYIKIEFSTSLKELNSFGTDGWKIFCIIEEGGGPLRKGSSRKGSSQKGKKGKKEGKKYFLLERQYSCDV